MNQQSDSQNCSGLFDNFTSRAFNPCIGYLPCLRRQHQVHPDKNCPTNSCFVNLGSERQIRVVHIQSNVRHFTVLDGNRLSSPTVEYPVEALSPQLEIGSIKSRSHSIISNISEQSEDYWFTRWSRPLRQTEACNCSFRKSWTKSLRDSRFSNHILPGTQEEEVHFDQVDHPLAPKAKNLASIENFVEALVQEILCETFRYLSENEKLNKLQNKFPVITSQPTSSNHVSQVDEEPVFDSICRKKRGKEENKKGSQDGMASVKRGCVNPNFIGSECEPDVLDDSINANSIYLSQVECAISPAVLGRVNNTIPVDNTHIFESRTQSPPTDESKRFENAFSLGSVLESNILETTNPEVHLRKQQNSCGHPPSVTPRLKPVLFFLHAVGCSADIWSSLVRHFAREGYEVVAPDMLGHGYSSAPDKSAAYQFHHLLKDALDIFDKFIGEHKICVVIGHAYGCSLAAAMARYRPQQVSQLVLISGGGPTPLAPRTDDCRPPSISPCLQVLMKPLLMCGFRRDILYAPCGKHISYGDAMSSGIPAYVLRHIALGQDWPEGDSAFHRRIPVPTLLVHGMKDPYVTLVQECEMERTIPRSFLELIPNAGHFAMLEAPKKLSHMIQCFIEWWSR